MLKHYGLSLQFGNKFIYQSMPRLLTLWLDFGAKVNEHGKKEHSSSLVALKCESVSVCEVKIYFVFICLFLNYIIAIVSDT